MADQKITELTAFTALIDTDVFPMTDITAVQTKKTTWANIKSVLKTYFDTLYTLVPTGAISIYSTTTAPTGWLVCNGSAVDRTTYAALYAVVGTTYGNGNGTTTFNLPNIKGKVPVGYNSSETEFDVMGETGGAKTHTLITSEMPSHTHTGYLAANSGGANYPAPQVNASASTYTTNSTGGDGAHNNLQPYITLQYIIKT